MTNGTSQGLFVIVAVVIFGIFTLISYLLFQDDLRPKLTSIFETPIYILKPDLNSNKLKANKGTSVTILHQSEKEIIFSTTGENNAISVYMPTPYFEKDKQYILEYSIELLDGKVEKLGGHSSLFEGMVPLSSVKNFYINNELKGNYYRGVPLVMEKGVTYGVKVVLNTERFPDDFNIDSSSGLYIQPNRSYVWEDGSADDRKPHETPPYTVKVTNFKISEKY